MKHISLITILLLIITSSSNCKKGSLFSDKLPPATQEGKNTCGFLVNGKVWLPRGDNGFPNLLIDYDEILYGGSFSLTGYRYESSDNSKFSGFGVSAKNIVSTGTYSLNTNSERIGRYSDATGSNLCYYEWYDTILNHNAYLKISKLDKVNRIIAGTFEFAQVKQGCEEVRITQGRFDMKY
jgi:Family of unknown function (DUF6252)